MTPEEFAARCRPCLQFRAAHDGDWCSMSGRPLADAVCQFTPVWVVLDAAFARITALECTIAARQADGKGGAP